MGRKRTFLILQLVAFLSLSTISCTSTDMFVDRSGQPKPGAPGQESPASGYNEFLHNVKHKWQEIVSRLPRSARVVVPEFDVGITVLGSFPSKSDALAISRDAAERLRRGIESDLVENGLIVLERSSVDRVRAEMLFSHSGIADEDTAMRIGKMLGATHLVFGKLRYILMTVKNPNGVLTFWRVNTNVRAIDIETLVLLGTADFTYDNCIPSPCPKELKPF